MAENDEDGAQQQGQEPKTFTQDEVNELMGKVRRETRAAPRTRGDDPLTVTCCIFLRYLALAPFYASVTIRCSNLSQR